MGKIIRNIDKPLLILSILLFVFGLVMIFSSSNVTAFMYYQTTPYNFFLKQALILGGGFILSFFMLRISTKAYGMLSWIGVIGIAAILVILLIIGSVQNQAISWFDFGILSFQPSEFAKVIIIVWLARYYEINSRNLSNYIVLLIPLAVSAGIALLIALQPDLGTTIIFVLIVFIMFFAVDIPSRIKSKIIMLLVGLAAVFGLVMMSSGSNLINARQLERFSFANPCEDLLTTGSQVCNGYIAINNGGLTGVGLGNSTQKYLYLPEPYTDFIFAIIVEELGLVFVVVLMALYSAVLVRIITIARKSYTNRGALICYGVFTYIVIHILINLLGVLGLMPMTGVPLPFMSYGGSFALSLIMALMLVQRVNIETKLREKERKK